MVNHGLVAIPFLSAFTSLHVLNLSGNFIGLASCSSLKELYLAGLAGNKISDVEGLHRLLKLNFLDLRGNKISTAKGLGQLAANYRYLQSINLDGNPAQRNVGDKQLKKYLLTLLPNLVYYNKQSIKASGAKEISDRSSSRSGTKTEHKLGQRGSHGSGLHKLALSHVRSSHTIESSLKQSRSQNVESRHVLPLLGSRNPDSIRRNRSEGAF